MQVELNNVQLKIHRRYVFSTFNNQYLGWDINTFNKVLLKI